LHLVDIGGTFGKILQDS